MHSYFQDSLPEYQPPPASFKLAMQPFPPSLSAFAVQRTSRCDIDLCDRPSLVFCQHHISCFGAGPSCTACIHNEKRSLKEEQLKLNVSRQVLSFRPVSCKCAPAGVCNLSQTELSCRMKLRLAPLFSTATHSQPRRDGKVPRIA